MANLRPKALSEVQWPKVSLLGMGDTCLASTVFSRVSLEGEDSKRLFRGVPTKFQLRDSKQKAGSRIKFYRPVTQLFTSGWDSQV